MSIFNDVFYGGLWWTCPSGDCGTAPCYYCAEMMGKAPLQYFNNPNKIKEERRKEYFPFLEPKTAGK